MPYVATRPASFSYPTFYGLGDAQAAADVAKYGGVASSAITAVAAPAVAHILGITAASAVPIVGIAFAGILFGVEAILNSGCGETCVVTSQWANQAEPLLVQNIQTYFSLPAPRTNSQKQSALNIFDAIWGGLMERCSQPGLSTAGRNCIADRQSGACKWHQDKTPSYPNPPVGSCWNWFSGYRDPIANDPTVSDDAAAAALGLPPGSIPAVFGQSSGNLLPLVALAALVALAVML